MELRKRTRYNFRDTINGKRPTKKQTQIKEVVHRNAYSYCVMILGIVPKKRKGSCRQVPILGLGNYFIVCDFDIFVIFRRKNEDILRSMGGLFWMLTFYVAISTPYSYFRNEPVFLRDTDDWVYLVVSMFHLKLHSGSG